MSAQHRARPGFSLLDVLVSIAVIAILIALLLPSFASVNETARRVICQSNVRQIGLGMLMYADENRGYLPPSLFLETSGPSRGAPRPQEMVTLRVSPTIAPDAPWDGLGILFAQGFVPAPKVFYCPSHSGQNAYTRYAQTWSTLEASEIVCNYHYRGQGPAGHNSARNTRQLHLIDPAQSSLISDGMREKADYNHKVGVNFFRADLTVHWFDDPAGRLLTLLPSDKENATAEPIIDAWHMFDQAANEER